MARKRHKPEEMIAVVMCDTQIAEGCPQSVQNIWCRICGAVVDRNNFDRPPRLSEC